MIMNNMRIPPHNDEAEISLLSAMLFDSDAMVKAVTCVEKDDFYSPVNKAVFDGMLHLFSGNMPVDLVGLHDMLEKMHVLDKIDGINALKKIAGYVSTSANTGQYIRIVKEAANRRRLIQWAGAISNAAYGNDDFQSVCEIVSSTPTLNGEKSEKGTGEIIREAAERAVERYTSPDKTVPGCETGFADLDYTTGGVKNGETIFVIAEPNVGKSLLVQQICLNFARAGKTAAYFNYEMNDSQIGDRILAMAMPISVKKIKYPKQHMRLVDFEQMKNSRIDEELDKFLYIFSKTNKTAAEITARCKELTVKGKKPDIIGVDYIQLMNGAGENERVKLENNSKALKSIAQAFDCPVIIVSSLNRQGTMRNSGQLDFDADQIWTLKRDHKSHERNIRCAAKIELEKNRDGGKGEVDLLFVEDLLRFDNVPEVAKRK